MHSDPATLIDPRNGRRLDPLAMVRPADLADPAFAWAVELGAVAGTVAGVADLAGPPPASGLAPCQAAELEIVQRTAVTGQAAGHLPIGPPDVVHAHASDPLELIELLEALTTPCTCGGRDGCDGAPLVTDEEATAIRAALDAATDGVLVVVRLVLIPHVFLPPLGQLPPPATMGQPARRPIIERRT